MAWKTQKTYETSASTTQKMSKTSALTTQKTGGRELASCHPSLVMLITGGADGSSSSLWSLFIISSSILALRLEIFSVRLSPLVERTVGEEAWECSVSPITVGVPDSSGEVVGLAALVNMSRVRLRKGRRLTNSYLKGQKGDATRTLW